MWVAACDTGIRTVHGLLGHRDVGTTMICPHVLNRGPGGVRSPVDGLAGGGRDAGPGVGAHWGCAIPCRGSPA